MIRFILKHLKHRYINFAVVHGSTQNRYCFFFCFFFCSRRIILCHNIIMSHQRCQAKERLRVLQGNYLFLVMIFCKIQSMQTKVIFLEIMMLKIAMMLCDTLMVLELLHINKLYHVIHTMLWFTLEGLLGIHL